MQSGKVTNHVRFANLNFNLFYSSDKTIEVVTFYSYKVTKALNIFQNKLLFILIISYNYFLEFLQ